MKVHESAKLEGEKLVVHQKHDWNPILDKAKQLREAGATDFGESKLVGVLPMKLLHEWAKEAGVDFSDTHAMQEIIRKKMLSGDFDKFRVWEGTY